MPPAPPPEPDSPSAPGAAFVCNPRSLPSARFVRDHSGLAAISPTHPLPIENRKVVCWRWDEDGLWPPTNTHQDAYESQKLCGGESAREVRWDDDFRQSRMYHVYRSKLNEDTCLSANNGICEDGGQGDTRSYDHFLWRSHGFSHQAGSDLPTKLPTSEWRFNRINFNDPRPEPGQFVYLHGLRQTAFAEKCYDTGTLCSVDWERNRPGRLTVNDSGRETIFGTESSTGLGRPFFTALTDPSDEPVHCASTSPVKCKGVNCESGSHTQCSYNVFAIGATEGTPLCGYGTDRSDCGDRSDVVVWGWSAADVCFIEHRMWHEPFAMSSTLDSWMAQGYDLRSDNNCNDGGASIYIGPRCPYGAE